MGRPSKKDKRAAHAAAMRAAKAARVEADDDGDDDDGAAGAAAGAGIEPALPATGVGVPLEVPIEQIGQLVDESMTQPELEGDVTMEQTVDEAHGAGLVLGDPVGSQDSESNDISLLQAAEEEEAEAEARAKQAADEAALQQQQQQRPPPRRRRHGRLDDDAVDAMRRPQYRAAQSQEAQASPTWP